MPRKEVIRVSKDEKDTLERAREARYGTNEVPYGAVVETLAEYYLTEDN